MARARARVQMAGVKSRRWPDERSPGICGNAGESPGRSAVTLDLSRVNNRRGAGTESIPREKSGSREPLFGGDTPRSRREHDRLGWSEERRRMNKVLVFVAQEFLDKEIASQNCNRDLGCQFACVHDIFLKTLLAARRHVSIDANYFIARIRTNTQEGFATWLTRDDRCIRFWQS